MPDKKAIDFGPGHALVAGITGSGKTWGTVRSLAKKSEPVIFFNTKNDDTIPSSYVQMDSGNSYMQLKRAITRGRKINFIPSRDEVQRARELRNMVHFLFDMGKLELYFVVDEVQLYQTRGMMFKLMEISTTGRSFGIHAVWMSQRPARIDNDLMTQVEKFIMFQCPMENQYLKRYGFPTEDMDARLKKGGQYSFVEFDLANLSGPYKV